MIINDETVQHLRAFLDAVDLALSENLMYQEILVEAGVPDWQEKLALKLKEEQPEIAAKLADIRELRRENSSLS